MQTSTFTNSHLSITAEILNCYIDNHPGRSEDMKRFLAHLQALIVDYKELLNLFYEREIQQTNIIRSLFEKSQDNSLRDQCEPCLPDFFDPGLDDLLTLLSTASERLGS